mmetsp:Transcript_22509/g.44222  ORF Transcript_22509/g.44222 Transcript_22509/m.44222 type:complete len:83 (-) Transcript_22509:485-733(-)
MLARHFPTQQSSTDRQRSITMITSPVRNLLYTKSSKIVPKYNRTKSSGFKLRDASSVRPIHENNLANVTNANGAGGYFHTIL